MNRLAIAVATFFGLNRSAALVQWILASSLPLPNVAIFLAAFLGGIVKCQLHRPLYCLNFLLHLTANLNLQLMA